MRGDSLCRWVFPKSLLEGALGIISEGGFLFRVVVGVGSVSEWVVEVKVG